MMEQNVQIPFQQLLTIVKSLTPDQKIKLKQELNEEAENKHMDAFIELLLNGPVFSEKEIQTIEVNRKSIARWRAKN